MFVVLYYKLLLRAHEPGNTRLSLRLSFLANEQFFQCERGEKLVQHSEYVRSQSTFSPLLKSVLPPLASSSLLVLLSSLRSGRVLFPACLSFASLRRTRVLDAHD